MSTAREDILQFLGHPAAFAAGVADGDPAVWLAGLTGFARPALAAAGGPSLRPAQVSAWERMAAHRAALVLGPPGTGKSFALAWMAAGYVHARRAAGLPCRVLVAGFTRESMGNLLDAFARVAAGPLRGVPVAFMGNMPEGGLDPAVRPFPLRGRAGVEPAVRFLNGTRHCCVGINGWQLAKLCRTDGLPEADGHTARVFDLVLIDEASQMPVSQGLMAVAALAEGGRIVVAGDDRQLGPVRATFDAPAADGRVIGGSLYQFLKTGGVLEVGFEETFRLNGPLVTFPAQHLYDNRYTSAVPDRRLQLRPGWTDGLEPWQRVALDPECPVVVILHDGPAAATENPFERHLIRSLVRVMAERLAPADGRDAMDERTLWDERLAVVTPHRAQNAALREELAVVPLCGRARVETVDRFQGRERDAIVAGYTVADAEFAQQEAAFLFGAERLNVTVTRPRSKLVLLASRRLLTVLPADEDVFDDAQLFREYLYECAGVGTVTLEASDGTAVEAEVRVRAFDPAAEAAAAAVLAGDGPAAPAGGGVVRLTYAAEQVTSGEILRELGLVGQSYTYVVATGGLKRLRTKELAGPPHQRDRDGTDPVLKFDEVARDLIDRHSDRPVLSRTSERVFLQRAIQRALAADPDLARQVRHDLFPWLDALAEVAERGLDLSRPLPPALEATLVTRAVGQTLAVLQAAHRAVRPSPDLRTFEEAAHTLLDGGRPLHVGRSVVMDGFTFLTALQRRFVDAFLRQGATVCFVHPYDPDRPRGFAALDRTYAPFAAVERLIPLPADPAAAGADDLDQLRRGLFADAPPPAAAVAVDRVTFDVYPHRHDEVEAVMRRIKAYVDGGDPRLRSFAIVSRNPREFESLLHEQAAVHGLPNSVGLHPRHLLMLPLGRFALALYRIRVNGALDLSADHLETMLASGWLGDDVQRTTDAFAAVRPQVFDRCRSRADWDQALDQVARIGDGRGGVGQADPGWRLPSAAATPGVVRRWRRAVDQVDALSRRLLDGPADQSIGGRVRQLLDELARVDPGKLRDAEREVLRRIRDALTAVVDPDAGGGGGMRVTGTEFGEVLNSLVKEYDRDAAADGGEPPADDPADDPINGAARRPPRLWVCPPEAIDTYPVDVVFYLAVDDQRVPRPPPSPWPFDEPDAVARSAELERYYFMAVARAARHRLHVSYAARGEGTAYAPSPYFAEARAALGRPAAGPAVAATAPVLPVDAAEPPRPVTRAEYALHEVAIAGLCPYRYKLERLDDGARLCRDAFQMRFMARSVWIEAAYEDARGTTVRGRNEAAELLRTAMGRTADPVRAMFPAIRDHHWHPVEAFTARSLEQVADFIGGLGNYAAEIRPAPADLGYDAGGGDGRPRVAVNLGLRHVFQVGRFPRPLTAPILHREWMLPSINGDPRSTTYLTRAGDGRYVFASLYKAVQWWQTAARHLLKWDGRAGGPDPEITGQVTLLVRQIETGRYPKNPGPHCRVCPAKPACLGVPEPQGEA